MQTDEPKVYRGDISKAILPLKLALELTGLSKVGFLDIVRAGWIKRHAPGQYKLRDVVRGMDAYIQRPRASANKSKSAIALLDARTRQIEADIKRKATTLIRTDLVLATLDQTMRLMREAALEIPSQVDAPVKDKARIQIAITQMFERADERLTKMKAMLAEGADHLDDETDDAE